MMRIPKRSQAPIAIPCVSGALLSLVFLATPSAVLAHGGHGDEFQGGTEATLAAGSIQVDAETAKRLGIKVVPVTSQRLAVGIKTTGQVETLPNKTVEVTTPISEAKVVELLVEPGAVVKAGQPVAVLAAPDLVELRVSSQEKRAEALADVQQAQADLSLAQQNLERQRQIAAAEIAQARTEVKVAQEQYDRDRDLMRAGAIPRRQMLESQAHLEEGKAQLAKAASRQEVLDAVAQFKRAQASVEVAQSRLRLSNATYQTRLQQLGAKANANGLVTVTAPISGRVADREVTLGQSFEDAGGKLMTIVNDSQVFATANIYEKDLDKVKMGQQVNVKVPSLSNRTFTGRIAVIGSLVEGETRVVPVKAQLDNSDRVLKPGMFAELEVLIDQTPTAILAIPSAAVVEASGKKLVYLQNGNAYQPVEVTLGQTSGDIVQVKSGLFEGDLIVTQRAPQLYAQSLRGGSKTTETKHKEATSQATAAKTPNFPVPWWLIGTAGGGAIATVAFMAGAFWSNRRTPNQLVSTSAELGYDVSEEYLNNSAKAQKTPEWVVDNHRVTERNEQ
jgi:cobalt-zinc-cadmium efflux system membrane fusion protein